MANIQARRASWIRLDAYNRFVETYFDYLNDETTEEIDTAIMTIGIDLCCELNELWKDEVDSCGDPTIWKIDRMTGKVAMREQLIAQHANFFEAMPDGKPRYMTFMYVEKDEKDEK